MSTLTENQTRVKLIDPLIKESGFLLNNKKDKEYEVQGMPNDEGIGYIDYVLWSEDGFFYCSRGKKNNKSLKKENSKLNYMQIVLRKSLVEDQLLYSNGYEHWFWDDTNYPSRWFKVFIVKMN